MTKVYYLFSIIFLHILGCKLLVYLGALNTTSEPVRVVRSRLVVNIDVSLLAALPNAFYIYTCIM